MLHVACVQGCVSHFSFRIDATGRNLVPLLRQHSLLMGPAVLDLAPRFFDIDVRIGADLPELAAPGLPIHPAARAA
jgi:hypothetical protein